MFSISSLTNLALSSPSSLTCGKFLKSSKKISVIPSMSPVCGLQKRAGMVREGNKEKEQRRKKSNRSKERKLT